MQSPKDRDGPWYTLAASEECRGLGFPIHKLSEVGFSDCFRVDILVRNGLVVTPDGMISGDVAIEGEKIVAVGAESGLPSARRTIDAQRALCRAGFIDAHVHLGPGGMVFIPSDLT